jgi:hypothetical protein
MVPAREFSERRALRTSPAGLGLLRIGQFRRSSHVPPGLLRPAAPFGSAGADKVALHVREASEDGTGAGRPVRYLPICFIECSARVRDEEGSDDGGAGKPT